MLAKMWSNSSSHSPLMGMQNGAACSEESLPVSYTAKYMHYMGSRAPWHLPKQMEKSRPHKNLHTHL